MSNRKVFLHNVEVDFEGILEGINAGIAFELNRNLDTNLSVSEDSFISEYSKLYFEKFGVKDVLVVEYWED